MDLGWVKFFNTRSFELTNRIQFRLVNMNTGDLAYYTVDSLSAFWPGLQVLAGDVENAIKLHLLCESLHAHRRNPQADVSTPDYNVWKLHSGLPEVFDTNYRVATSHQYPLRPGSSFSLTVLENESSCNECRVH